MATIPPWQKFPTKAQVDADALKSDLEKSIRNASAQHVKRLEQSLPVAKHATKSVEKHPMPLTDAQKRVMSWIGKGWTARRSYGAAIEVNGKRVCNVDTMMALYRKGFAQQAQDGTWAATDSGKNLVAQLGL